MDNTIMIAYYLGRRSDNKETSLFDMLVCLATFSKYSHLEYVEEYSPETGYAVCWSASPRDGGVRRRIINISKEHWEVYQVKGSASNEQMVAWFRKYLNARYDWIGAFATKLPIIRENISRWFCSETIAAALGLPNPSEMTPQDMFNKLEGVSSRVYLKSFSS